MRIIRAPQYSDVNALDFLDTITHSMLVYQVHWRGEANAKYQRHQESAHE